MEGRLPPPDPELNLRKFTCPTIARDKGKESPVFGCDVLLLRGILSEHMIWKVNQYNKRIIIHFQICDTNTS